MMNIIFVFGGIALGAILIIENMVTGLSAYVFIDGSSKTYILSFVSIIIGIFIGYGLRGMLEKDDGNDNDMDF
ncbi:MAG: hypothetical protein PHS49_01265 [Candidatus Gracilibacteria bacterium]|nr:hypothetical protein [Candidatus Gracilibacteria bacterium]